jgi:DNA repair protein RecO (recombination protein O)
MEWTAPGLLLSVRPFGEADAIVAAFTEEHGRHLGLAHGGQSRRQAATWQPGNLLQLRWVGRLADQLGSLTGELVHPAAAAAMDDPLALALLTAACAVADGALPERAPHPRAFALMVQLVAALADPHAALRLLIRWEAALLTELGYGLDLTRCALTGAAEDLAFVSPRTGRAVAAAAAGQWRQRLLNLPPFLRHDAPAHAPELADLADGLRLTGHFLARDVFGAHNRPLPQPRRALHDRVVRLTFPDSPEPEVSAHA